LIGIGVLRMTALTISAPSTDRVEEVYSVFKEAAHPLTTAQAQKMYSGTKLAKGELSRIVEDQLVMQGRLFRCSPAGKNARFWVFDEEEKVREAVMEHLGRGDLTETALATAANKTLPKISSPVAIKRIIARMEKEKRLYEIPGREKTKRFSLRPFDATTLIVFKNATLKDLKAIFVKVERLGVSLDQFLQTIRQTLRPSEASDGSRHPTSLASPDGNIPSQVVSTSQDSLRGGRTSGVDSSSDPAARGVEATSRQEVSEETLTELEALILKGMRDLDPAVETGATVLIRDLRRHMPAEYREHMLFDAAVMRLAEEGRIVLHRHDQPGFMSESQLDELVRDSETGTYFTSLAHRM
jgi:hypothetical protein